MATAKKKTTPTITSLVEKHLMRYKKIAVGDVENEYNLRPDQFYRSIYELRSKGYPITSIWVENEYGERYKLYSIPSKWSKKSLNK